MRLGPTGYTRNPQIRDVLDPCETEIATGYYLGGVIRFEGVTGKGLRQIFSLVPEAMWDDAHNDAPTFREFVGLSDLYPTMTFSGYRVTGAREDERITITELFLPASEVTPDVLEILSYLNPVTVAVQPDGAVLSWEEGIVGTEG